jgi:hypothetical protein
MKTTQLQTLETAVLRARKAALVKEFPPVGAVLRGSLIERFLRCGKPGCKCARGRGHGPKRYLSISHPQSRPEMIYVPELWCERVGASLESFTKVREILEEISAINAELIRRREEV